jgi:hypothetical protein
MIMIRLLLALVVVALAAYMVVARQPEKEGGGPVLRVEELDRARAVSDQLERDAEARAKKLDEVLAP